MHEIIEQYGDVIIVICGILSLMILLGACFLCYQDNIVQFFSSIFYR